MATRKQQTTNYKRIFFVVLAIFCALVARWGYLKVSDIILQKNIVSVQNEIEKEKVHLASFSEEP
jgi:hypothetical protein